MVERKYVILKDFDTGREFPIVFHRDLSHHAVANGVIRAMARNEWGPPRDLEAVSAGFCSTDLLVEGKRGSESLKLEPRDIDGPILRGMDNPRLMATNKPAA